MYVRLLATSVIFGFGLLLGGCKPKEQVEAERQVMKDEQGKLQGKWKLVSRQVDEDEETPDAAPPSFYYVIEGDLMKQVVRTADGKEDPIEVQKLVIIADKDPKQLDMVLADEKGNPIKFDTVKKGITGKRKKTTTTAKNAAIYKLDGDKLTICVSWDEKKRPTDFTAVRGTGRYVLALEKMKSGDEAKVKEEVKKAKEEVKKDKEEVKKVEVKKDKEEAKKEEIKKDKEEVKKPKDDVKKDKEEVKKDKDGDKKPKDDVKKDKDDDKKPKDDVKKDKDGDKKPKDDVKKDKDGDKKPKDDVKKDKDDDKKPKDDVKKDK